MTAIAATQFITDECNMKPMSRLGIKTADMHVYSPSGNMIGYYRTDSAEFEPIKGWKLQFSTKLVERCGLTR